MVDPVRFTPAELQQLAQSGDLTPDDIKKMDPQDKKVALEAYIAATANRQGSKMSTNGVIPPIPASIAGTIGAGIDGLTGGGGGVAAAGAAGKSLWDKIAPHAGGVVGGELAQQTGLPWWIGSIIGGHLGSKATGGGKPPSGPVGTGEIPYKPTTTKVSQTPPMSDEAYKAASGHERGIFPTPADPTKALGDLLNSKPGSNPAPPQGNLEKWGNLTSPGPANVNQTPMTGEIKRLTAPTKSPWEDSRNIPLDTPTAGEKSVESIQEEISKLLDKMKKPTMRKPSDSFDHEMSQLEDLPLRRSPK